MDRSLRIRLTEGARQGSAAYSTQYVEDLRELLDSTKESDISISRAIAIDSTEARRAIVISALYNDLTLLQFNDGGERSLSWLSPNGFDKLIGKDGANVAVPSEHIEAFNKAISRNEIGFAFSMPGTDRANRLLSDSSWLIDAGRLIVRPNRLLSYTTGETTPDGGRMWMALNAKDDTSPDHWEVNDEKLGHTLLSTSKFFESNNDQKQFSLRANITIPYISGISLKTFAEILQDEEDLLKEFRAEMRKILLLNKPDALAYKLDVIDPRVAKINRKFNHISRMRSLRAGGAFLATAGLAIGSVATGGIAGAAQVLLGSAGAMVGVKELGDHSSKIAELKDDPLFMLWKMQRSR